MRKLSSNYSVTYTLLNKNTKSLINESKTACYSKLYRSKIQETDILILEDFLAEETSQYSKRYIRRIAKICQVRIVLLEENRVTITGFQSRFLLKLFTTLFRILFEIYSEYGDHTYAKKTQEFFKSYVGKRNTTKYKDMLERLIYHYQKSKCYHGPGHGISRDQNQKIKIKSTDQLIDWVDESGDMQDFFK